MYKARSITSKASSACRMNMDLIEGDREVQQKLTKKVGFDEAAEGAMGALGGGKKQAPAADEDGGGQSDVGGQSEGAIDVAEDKAPAPTPMRRSPAKIDPATIMKVAPMILGAMGNKNKGSKDGNGSKTTVVVNNQRSSGGQTSRGQADNAIDPK